MKYLILNIAGIGDFFELIRWIYLLRKKEKDALIDVVVSDRVYSYASGCPYVDNIYFLKSKENHIPFNLKIFNLIPKLRSNNYDYVINTTELSFWGSIKMRLFLSLLRKTKTIGFGYSFYDEVIYYDGQISHYLYYKVLFEKIGIRDIEIAEDILWYDGSYEIESVIGRYKYKKLIFINPCGNTITKRWDINICQQFINKIYQAEFLFVFVCIKRDEGYIDEIINGIQNKKNVLKIILYDWIKLIKKSDLIISVDSSAVHIASLFNKPTVVIYGPSDPKRTMPYNNKNIKFIYKRVSCSPCNYFKCPNKNDEYMLCMKQINVDDIIEKFKEFNI